MQATYSIVLIPAKNQNPEPRDKSYDAVQDQLAQEIEGEGFNVPDVNNPEESRTAIHEEMRQRLARRNFPENAERRLHRFQDESRRLHHQMLGLPNESIYLSPSDIKEQNYGRIHVPDYRYGRTYERIYDIETAQAATRQEVERAERDLKNQEVFSVSALGGLRGQSGRRKNPEEDTSLDYSNTARQGIAPSSKLRTNWK
jgi:hypothetical protein